MKKRYLPIFMGILSITILLGFTLFSCSAPGGSSNSGTSNGSLAISINDSVSSSEAPAVGGPEEDIFPTISMNPASYHIAGLGPNGATFEETTTGNSLVVNALAFGDWTLTITALNTDGTSIGVGSSATTVQSNATSMVNVIVRPYDGLGTLNLSLAWTEGDVNTPQVESTLTPNAGLARELAFSVGSGTATFNAPDVPAGYHTLVVKLLDNGALTMGAVDVVRIVADNTTTGSFTFDQINKATGSIEVGITPEMGDPLTVEIAGGADTKGENETMSLSASVTNYSENVSYVWYVNGDSVDTGASFDFDDSWAQGYYNINVTAYNTDGSRAGSTGVFVEVVAGDFIEPSDIFNLRITDKGTDYLIAEWDLSTDNSGGEVMYDIRIQRENTTPIDMSQTSNYLELDNLYIYTPYTISVRARDLSGNFTSWFTVSDRTEPIDQITSSSQLFSFDNQGISNSNGDSGLWDALDTDNIIFPSGKFNYCVSGSDYDAAHSGKSRLASTSYPSSLSWNTNENLFISLWFNPAVWETEFSTGVFFGIYAGELINGFNFLVGMSPSASNPDAEEGSYSSSLVLQKMKDGVPVYGDSSNPVQTALVNTWHHMGIYINRSDYKVSLSVDGVIIGEILVGEENWPAENIDLRKIYIILGMKDRLRNQNSFIQIDDLVLMPGLNTCIDLAEYHYLQGNPWREN